MASSSSTWADQWDNNNNTGEANQVNVGEKKTARLGGGDRKYSEKMGHGIDKTKAVASRGFTKVKVGASFSVQWIKEKYHKTTRKH